MPTKMGDIAKITHLARLERYLLNSNRGVANENNRIKCVACSRYVAMGCGRGLYARYEGVGFAVVHWCVCVVG